MPAQNYVLLERIELNASAASVTFSNIPQTGYTDLKIVSSTRVDVNDAGIILSFNGSTASRTVRGLYGDGSATASYSGTSPLAGISNYTAFTANTFSNNELYIPNYTSSNFKSSSMDGVSENNGTGALDFMAANLWSNTAAITSVTLTTASGNFVQYSTFSLYGLAAVGTTPTIAPKASGGDVIDYDGTYWIHTFTTTGAFVPAVGLSCDVLAVAGGGGGGSGIGGGGGAGGMQTSTISLANSTSYTVTVGAGGAAGGSSSATSQGSNGIDSTISTTTATGGGGGGGFDTSGGSSLANGKAGGSGGGAGVYLTGGNWVTGSAGTGSQGSNGGTAFGTSSQFGLGAGGGNSAVGGNGSSNTGGTGGAGTSNSLSGSAVVYAGGGGGAGQVTGGAGGNGGGGAGGSGDPSNGTAGTINRGGGGGSGRGGVGVGAAGGSGIVIIRYLAA